MQVAQLVALVESGTDLKLLEERLKCRGAVDIWWFQILPLCIERPDSRLLFWRENL